MHESETTVRPATIDDAPVLVEFNVAMARETEDKALAPEVVEAGVRRVFDEPARGHYLVAESDGQVVGALLVTPEWSDWRNGDFWWIQSVYVRPGHRRQGIFHRLFHAVRRGATSKAGVCGLRLYVEHENDAAQQTYEALGMSQTAYRLYEYEVE